MQDQMSAKRALDEAMMDKLNGTSRSITILQFTKEYLLDLQGEGWTGMLLLTGGKSTFSQDMSQDQTTFIRVRSPRVASPVANPCVAHAVSVAPQVLLKQAQMPNV